jgi:hypothetical protein
MIVRSALVPTALLMVLAIAGSACKSSGDDNGDTTMDVPVDIPKDMVMDAPVDIPRDMVVDVPVDIPVDIPGDMAMDVPEDMMMDVPEDMMMDVPEDTAMDVEEDVPGDMGTDTGPEGPFDLVFSGTGFAPHEGQFLFVALVEVGGGLVGSDLDDVVGGVFSFTFAGLLEEGKTYNLDYFADQNGNEECDAPPTDHVWRDVIPAVTGDVMVDIVHNTVFTAAACDSF